MQPRDRSGAPPARRTRFVLAVLLATLSGAACLALLEFSLRLFVPRYDPGAQVHILPSGPERPRLGPPGSVRRQVKNTGDYDVTVRFNRHGLRDPKDLVESTERDWFVVGDSFGFGWGVEEEERFSTRLERRSGVPVFNISIPGSDLIDYERLVSYAEKRGATVRRLLVTFCMENDLGAYPSPGVTPEYRPVRGFHFKTALAKRSAVYALVTHAVHSSSPLRRVAIRLGFITPNLGAIPRHRFSLEVLEATRDRLRHLHDSEMLILVVPSRGLWVGERRAEIARIHERFVSLLREAGLQVVDLRPEMEAGGSPLDYHFRRDGHWNASGHELAAAVLAAALEARADPPPDSAGSGAPP